MTIEPASSLASKNITYLLLIRSQKKPPSLAYLHLPLSKQNCTDLIKSFDISCDEATIFAFNLFKIKLLMHCSLVFDEDCWLFMLKIPYAINDFKIYFKCL